MFIFLDIHKKQGRSSSNSGYKIQTKKGWKIYSRTRTFGAAVHKSNIRVKRWHYKYENSELDWRSQLLFKWFSYQVQSYWNTKYRRLLAEWRNELLGHPVEHNVFLLLFPFHCLLKCRRSQLCHTFSWTHRRGVHFASKMVYKRVRYWTLGWSLIKLWWIALRGRSVLLTWPSAMQVYWNKSTFFRGLLWDTNVADVLLFLSINKAGVVSCGNALRRILSAMGT